jgi:hypothetical protein
MHPVVFIEEQPVVEFDAVGVKISYHSGGENFACRVTRGWYRRYLETSLRALNEYERTERAERKVVRMESRGHR